MSSKKNTKKKENKVTVKKDQKISSVIEVKEKDNKLVYVLFIVVAILLSLLIYFIFFKDCKKKSDDCKTPTIEIEVEPKYQLVNYSGFKFKMPLNWDFADDNNDYTIADNNETIFITFDKVDIEYETFTSNEYQDNYLEQLQTSDNIKIDNSKKEDNYTIYEGSFNNYAYLIVAIGNDSKTILVKTQFIDKITYNDHKNDIIEFATSSIEKSVE